MSLRISSDLHEWVLSSSLADQAPDILKNPDFDAFLASGEDVRYRWSRNTFSCNDALKNALVEEAISSGKKIFNSPKVRLESDPTPHNEIAIGVTSYFDGLATNEFTQKSINIDGVNFDGHDIAYPGGEIPSLISSALSNHIGCCGLAIDEDDVLMLPVSSSANAVNGGKISPSGAGSCDLEDFNPDGGSLTAALNASIEREVREETGLPSNAQMETRIIGFRRILSRGGKPEFIGLTRISGRFEDLNRETSEEEKVFTSGHILCKAGSHDLKDLQNWRVKKADAISLSLHIALDAYLQLQLSDLNHL